jgi:hypothetical protein
VDQATGFRSCGEISSTSFTTSAAAPFCPSCASNILRGKCRGEEAKVRALHSGGLRHCRRDLDRVGIAAQPQASHPSGPQLRDALTGRGIEPTFDPCRALPLVSLKSRALAQRLEGRRLPAGE